MMKKRGAQSQTQELVARHMRSVLITLGHNKSDQHVADTPDRFARYLLEYHQPFDPLKVLKGFQSDREYHGIVAQGPIPFRGMCIHHLLPMYGRCYIGYIPNKQMVGLSKLTRLVQGIGHAQPSLQEYIGDAIADAMMKYLEPLGTIVDIHAHHGCMESRGVKSPGTLTHTSAIRGIFRDNPSARVEYQTIIGRAAS